MGFHLEGLDELLENRKGRMRAGYFEAPLAEGLGCGMYQTGSQGG